MTNIIYNDINESDYKFIYDDLEFYFSSKFYLEKFRKIFMDFIKEETIKMQRKFQCHIDADVLILLLLYKKIEKRGFRVLYKNRRVDENYYILFHL